MPDVLLPLFAGALLGALGAWLVVARRGGAAERALAEARRSLLEETGRRTAAEALAARLPDLEERLRSTQEALADARVELSQSQGQLTHEREATAEKVALLDSAKRQLEDTFKAASAGALEQNARTFLDLARSALAEQQERARGELDVKGKELDAVVQPLRESLAKVDSRIHQLEQARTGAYAQLTEQVRQLQAAQQELHAQTRSLVQALRAPATRGRWGEIQLKRVVEMAGMLEYCDFTVQETVVSEAGRLRPDMVVRLPNERIIVVDAKVPLEAFLDAREAGDEHARDEHLRRHAAQIRAHIRKLSEKAYWAQFDGASPEFVVLFLPGEPFYSAALESDAELIEHAVEQRVLIATPMTLIALLKAVSFGWRQETIAREAQQISQAGSELYKRVRAFAAHFEHMRKGLDRAVGAYNRAVGSLERSVLPAARRMRSLGAGSGDPLPTAERIDHHTRGLTAEDLRIVGPEQEEDAAHREPRVIQTEL